MVTAFVAGQEKAHGEWRSICRQHDTAGVIYVLMHDGWPLAIRWGHQRDFRIDIHHSAALIIKDLIEAHSRRIGARIGNPCTDWGLFTVLRSRSVPCS